MPWKYSKERLAKHEYCAYVINAKKVLCICGKKIKLNRRWEEDYLERHVKRNGCKASEGQRSIYNYFQPSKDNHQDKRNESSDEEWDSDVYDNMDDDDLLQVDEIAEQSEETVASRLYIDDETFLSDNDTQKRFVCKGLQSEEIFKYIKRTPAQFGGSRRIEIIARELYPNLFSKAFSRRKLNYVQKRKLNRAVFAECVWQIDRASKF